MVFILDEVMTSRLSPGGAASLYGIKPDIKTFGKYLGGGMAFGAFGGREAIMRLYDPRVAGYLAHSGTFNNNTMVLYAGHTGLAKVFTPDVCVEFNKMGSSFREKLAAVTRGTRLSFTGVGTIMCSHFTESGAQEIRNRDDVQEIPTLQDLFWYEMLEDGFWIVRRGTIALILGTPQAELDRFVACVAGFVERHRDILAL